MDPLEGFHFNPIVSHDGQTASAFDRNYGVKSRTDVLLKQDPALW